MANNKLTALQVKAAGAGKLFDGGGLILNKSAPGQGFWIFRYTFLGKRRDMGIGGYPANSLAQARKERDRWASALAGGLDPVAERDALKAAEIEARDRADPSFEEMARMVFEAMRGTMRDNGTRGRWLSPLEIHIFPKIGHKRMSALHQTDIRDALAPIWKKKPPTAVRAINRIGIIFKKARRMGFECDPFAVEAAQEMLGTVLHTPKNIVATPWQDIPALYARLDNLTTSALCLRWMILTCVRSNGCRHARFDEIEDGVWTVPATRVKGKQGAVSDFRVPLSGEALRLAALASEVHNTFLFPGARGRTGITDIALHKALDKIKEPGHPHGFRTSFRTWVQDTDACSFDVAETVLGHAVGNRIERTYARSDLLTKRQIVMDKWAAHVTGLQATVVAFKK